MGLSARLAKLEERAARVVRCAWCRVSLVDDHEQKARGRTPTTDYVMRSCAFCGNKYRVPLDGFTAKERESFLLWAYTHDGETYRDERAYAAEEWWMSRAWIRVFTEPEHRAALDARQRQQAAKPDAYARERAELKAEADRLTKAEKRRQRREYGPRTFPLAAILRGLKEGLKDLDRRPYTTGYGRYSAAEKVARQVLIHARCMAACELVLWGSVDEATAAQIEARTAEVAAFDEGRLREQQERERVERERLAEMERRLRERAQEQQPGRSTPVGTPGDEGNEPADWLRRAGVGNYTPTNPVSRFRADPTAAVPRSPMVFDPNHPDAVQFQRSTPEELPDRLKYYRGEYFDGDR